jgi:ferredoxin
MAWNVKPEELLQYDYKVPQKNWMDVPPEFKPGTWCYPAKPDILEYLNKATKGDFPHIREWVPTDVDWKLPEDWRERIKKGFRERLDKYRSFKVFMDVCVRCGACADKCHFYIGGGDPKNMPVLRAELLRSIYRGEFTLAGKILGRLAGAQARSNVIKEWFRYFYQCSDCRGVAVLPLRHRNAGITMMASSCCTGGLQHQLDSGARLQLQPHRQPHGHPAPCLLRHDGVHVRRHRGNHRHQGQLPGERERP